MSSGTGIVGDSGRSGWRMGQVRCPERQIVQGTRTPRSMCRKGHWMCPSGHAGSAAIDRLRQDGARAPAGRAAVREDMLDASGDAALDVGEDVGGPGPGRRRRAPRRRGSRRRWRAGRGSRGRPRRGGRPRPRSASARLAASTTRQQREPRRSWRSRRRRGTRRRGSGRRSRLAGRLTEGRDVGARSGRAAARRPGEQRGDVEAGVSDEAAERRRPRRRRGNLPDRGATRCRLPSRRPLDCSAQTVGRGRGQRASARVARTAAGARRGVDRPAVDRGVEEGVAAQELGVGEAAAAPDGELEAGQTDVVRGPLQLGHGGY